MTASIILNFASSKKEAWTKSKNVLFLKIFIIIFSKGHNMVKLFSYLLLIILCIATSCRNDERENNLKLREDALLKKEQEFSFKDADYQSLLKMRDSLTLLKKDTSILESWPEFVRGVWNSKVVCTESNCSDYVVGDVRTDQWTFVNDSSSLVAKVSSKDKLVRVYRGTYKDSAISLKFNSDSTASKQVSMNISIDKISPEILKGTRIVNVGNTCIATFSVELVKGKTNPQ